MDLFTEIVTMVYAEMVLEAAIRRSLMGRIRPAESTTPLTRYEMEFDRYAPPTSKSDVLAIRNYVVKKGPFINGTVAPDPAKNNGKAIEARRIGQRLYAAKDYVAALEKLNESLCWAEGPNSEHLGNGYADRSAVYYDMGEYELALMNIQMAKRNNCPRHLMANLNAREQNCKREIAGSTRAKSGPKLAMNVEPNPARPFMAAGIVQQQIPGYGRAMVARRGFKAGDVILTEKAMLSAIGPELKYKNCHHCSAENFHSLIPCAKCVSVMYCSQECLQKAWKCNHRFECGITEKLYYLSQGNNSRLYMGCKAFFYGLTLFNDNLKQMMSFCKANGRTGGDPFGLDYTAYDPLEEFKVFHRTKLPAGEFEPEESYRFYAAVFYSIYMKHPPVRAIFTSRPQKDFMLRSMLDYMRAIGFLTIQSRQTMSTQLFPLASVCNHSCDPNTVAAIHCGQLKFIAIRPIAIDEQILISYGPLIRDQGGYERHRTLSQDHHFDECLCDACDPQRLRRMKTAAKGLPALPQHQLMAMKRQYENPAADEAAKLNMLQQFVERYAYAYPRDDYVRLLDVYRQALVRAFVGEVEDQLRATARRQVE